MALYGIECLAKLVAIPVVIKCSRTQTFPIVCFLDSDVVEKYNGANIVDSLQFLNGGNDQAISV